jgi:hypothetical protein
VNPGASSFRESLALHAEASSSSSSALVPSKVLKKAAKSLHRISWLSWWSQVILTTISAVTLLFARSVGAAGKNNLSQIFLAGTGRFFFTTSSIIFTIRMMLCFKCAQLKICFRLYQMFHFARFLIGYYF